MTLGKQAACLRTVGDRNPDPKIAALEEEFIELGNNIGMGPMGFVGKSMVVDCHIEVGYCHTGGMPMSVHAFCLSSRRAVARIHDDGRVEYRTDPNWFTTLHAPGDSRMAGSDGKLKTVRLKTPVSPEDIASLEIGTVVYLDGRDLSPRAKAFTSAWSRTASRCPRGSPRSATSIFTARRRPRSCRMAALTSAR